MSFQQGFSSVAQLFQMYNQKKQLQENRRQFDLNLAEKQRLADISNQQYYDNLAHQENAQDARIASAEKIAGMGNDTTLKVQTRNHAHEVNMFTREQEAKEKHRQAIENAMMDVYDAEQSKVRIKFSPTNNRFYAQDKQTGEQKAIVDPEVIEKISQWWQPPQQEATAPTVFPDPNDMQSGRTIFPSTASVTSNIQREISSGNPSVATNGNPQYQNTREIASATPTLVNNGNPMYGENMPSFASRDLQGMVSRLFPQRTDSSQTAMLPNPQNMQGNGYNLDPRYAISPPHLQYYREFAGADPSIRYSHDIEATEPSIAYNSQPTYSPYREVASSTPDLYYTREVDPTMPILRYDGKPQLPPQNLFQKVRQAQGGGADTDIDTQANAAARPNKSAALGLSTNYVTPRTMPEIPNNSTPSTQFEQDMQTVNDAIAVPFKAAGNAAVSAGGSVYDYFTKPVEPQTTVKNPQTTVKTEKSAPNPPPSASLASLSLTSLTPPPPTKEQAAANRRVAQAKAKLASLTENYDAFARQYSPADRSNEAIRADATAEYYDALVKSTQEEAITNIIKSENASRTAATKAYKEAESRTVTLMGGLSGMKSPDRNQMGAQLTTSLVKSFGLEVYQDPRNRQILETVIPSAARIMNANNIPSDAALASAVGSLNMGITPNHEDYDEITGTLANTYTQIDYYLAQIKGDPQKSIFGQMQQLREVQSKMQLPDYMAALNDILLQARHAAGEK